MPEVDPENFRAAQLNLAQLHTFRLVMKYGGYAAGAKASHLSVASVWQHIRSLEKAYGAQLFVRSGRQVRPTSVARQLYEHVSEVLVRLDSTFDVVETAADQRQIRLVTGVRMMLEDLAVPLAAFHRDDPECTLRIRHGNGPRAEELLLGDEADIGLTLEPGLNQESPHIHYEAAYTVAFLAVAAAEHPYMTGRSAKLQELAKHNLIVTASGTHGRDALDQALHREGLTARIAVETDNSAFTIACAAEGMGLGILAGRPKGSLTKGLTTRSLRRQLGQRKIVLMWKKGRLLTSPMLHLIEAIRALDSA